MHDIRLIRDNPESFDAALARRGVAPVSESLLALDARRREVATRMQEAQSRRNEASKAIGAAMAKGDKDTAEALKAEVATLKTTLPALEDEERDLSAQAAAALAARCQPAAGHRARGRGRSGQCRGFALGHPA
jgi:seryl-tRNA synthetase